MSETTFNRSLIQSVARDTARAQVGSIFKAHSLTTQERLDLLAELTVCAALDEVDRTEGWQVRSVGVLTALQASAVERLHRHLSQAD